MSNEAVDRARSLIGTRFRAQGRNPQFGLDCLGLAMCAYGIDVGDVRRDYRLSGDHRDELLVGLRPYFRRVASAAARAGDVMLVEVAENQVHLAVKTASGFVHADARRGVVETPGEPEWPIVAVARERTRRIKPRGSN